MDFSFFLDTLFPSLGRFFGIFAAFATKATHEVVTFLQMLFTPSGVFVFRFTNVYNGSPDYLETLGSLGDGMVGQIFTKILSWANEVFWNFFNSVCELLGLNDSPFLVSCLIVFAVVSVVVALVKFFVGLIV